MRKKTLAEWAHLGNAAKVRALLAQGVPVDSIDNGRFNCTPLQEAARNGHLAVVEMLIAAGANVSHVDNDYFSPASEAAANGHWEIALHLANAGANFDVYDSHGLSARNYVDRDCLGRIWREKFEAKIGPLREQR